MKLNANQYQRFLADIQFNEYPRMVGNPRQISVYSFEELWYYVTQWYGSNSCFVSHNAYPRIATINKKDAPTRISVSKIGFDFDDPDSLKKPKRDAKRLGEFLVDEGLSFTTNFSGRKGYQQFINLIPKTFKYEVAEGLIGKDGEPIMDSATALKQLVAAVQWYMADNLNLTTPDAHIVSDVKRLFRLPYTPHVNRLGEVSETHCTPLTQNQLFDSSNEDIVAISKNPVFAYETPPKPTQSLIDLIECFGIDLEEVISKHQYAPVKTNVKFTGKGKVFLDIIAQTKPCISEWMGVKNPPHWIRVQFALFAKKLKYDAADFERLYLDIAKQVGYTDVRNADYRHEQIDTIFGNPKYQREAGCKKIKIRHFCLGEKCPRFKRRA